MSDSRASPELERKPVITPFEESASNTVENEAPHSRSPTPERKPNVNDTISPKGKGKRRASSSTPESPTSPKKRRARASTGPAKRWTPDELETLLMCVAKNGVSKSTWENAIEGRAPHACQSTWK